MHDSPWFIPIALCAAAVASAFLLASGSLLTLYVQYITRTGKAPLASVPGIATIRKAFQREQEPEAATSRPSEPSVGP